VKLLAPPEHVFPIRSKAVNAGTANSNCELSPPAIFGGGMKGSKISRDIGTTVDYVAGLKLILREAKKVLSINEYC
jgi:hypothetical protein